LKTAASHVDALGSSTASNSNIKRTYTISGNGLIDQTLVPGTTTDNLPSVASENLSITYTITTVITYTDGYIVTKPVEKTISVHRWLPSDITEVTLTTGNKTNVVG